MASSTEVAPVWLPHDVADTNVWKFLSHVNKKHHLSLHTYDDLHRWSVEHLQDFWQEAFQWLQLAPSGSGNGCQMLNTTAADLALFPPPTFFPSESLNITELMLRDRRASDVAIQFAREGVSGLEKVTWGDFQERIRRCRSAMVASGIDQSDVVAAVISNSVDAMVICLAALSIGAVWSSSSCDLGTTSIFERYRQISPSIIFADNGYVYAQKKIGLADRIYDWSHRIGGETEKLQQVVVIDYTDATLDISKVYRGCTMRSFLERDAGQKLAFSPVPFSHPAFILYSSGTTGAPKCIVHSSGGVAIKVKTDMSLQHDVRRDDVVFQYTTTSWVMWVLNLLSLSSAGSMLLYDGSPFHPRPTVLLELAEEAGVSIFGTSPKYLGELKGLGISPRENFNLSKLRVVTSTGSTLSPELYNWFYSTGFPTRAQLISMSGGTDIAGCFVGGSPMLPVYAGEIQCKSLGMAVDIFDAASDSLTSVESEGMPGELVCTKPFPSQPLAFIGKQGSERYRASYFDRFGPKVWCQGDFIRRDPKTGGLTMLGRSDGVLNPSGVRFGSAEIYAVTETFPEIADSICVGQKRDVDEDERVLLFIKARSGSVVSADLKQRVAAAIKQAYSPRHVPKFIFEIADIPYTVNGKKCEINVKQIVSDRKAGVGGTVANPGALKLYEEFRRLPAEKHIPKSRKAKL